MVTGNFPFQFQLFHVCENCLKSSLFERLLQSEKARSEESPNRYFPGQFGQRGAPKHSFNFPAIQSQSQLRIRRHFRYHGDSKIRRGIHFMLAHLLYETPLNSERVDQNQRIAVDPLRVQRGFIIKFKTLGPESFNKTP